MNEQERSDEPTGERFIPEMMGGELIDAEHRTRYRFVAPHVRGRSVLDAGCGVGWGSALLLDAGARDVTGVDISSDAIRDASAREPRAAFHVGDLLELPFDDDSFDVVACFEAIEHTGDTARTLDQLVRVLRPGGLLFVSSPNPAVYAPGNPFHLNEEPPEALLAAVSERLPSARLYRQHVLIASALVADTEPDDGGGFPALVASVTPWEPGHDPYSVVVAGPHETPAIEPVVVCAPSTQLDRIATATDSMAAEISRLENVNAELTDALAELRRAPERDEQLRAATAATAAAEADLTEARTLRDSYAAMLLASEQDSARAATEAREAELQQSAAELQALTAKYRVVVESQSWRLTRPLRDAGSLLRRFR